MKNVCLIFIAIGYFMASMPLSAQNSASIPAYRTFTSPGISAALANDILAHLNVAVRDYYREFTRGNAGMVMIQDEQKFIQFLIDSGLFNTKAEPRPRGWEEVDFAIYIEMRDKKDICQISMITLANGEYYRAPVTSTKPHHIAKSISQLMADRIADADQKKTLKKNIDMYFANFWNFRTIDLYYNGAVFTPNEAMLTPLSAGIGFTLPLSAPLGFITRFSGSYYEKDQVNLSAGIGIAIQKAGRFCPELALLGGFIGNIQDEAYNGGPFLEPMVGFGVYLTENLKISATGSFQLAYFSTSKESSTKFIGGIKMGMGF